MGYGSVAGHVSPASRGEINLSGLPNGNYGRRTARDNPNAHGAPLPRIGDEGIDVNQAAQPATFPLCDPGDHHSRIAVAHERGPIKIFALQNICDIVDMAVQIYAGESRCESSPRPVRTGVKTLCPAVCIFGMTRSQVEAPCQAPCIRSERTSA
jgi:hypothetical protein